MRGNCKHCYEEFEQRRRNHLYCTQSCKTMASYKRNNYKYVSGRYEIANNSNKSKKESENSSRNNNKKNKRLDAKLDKIIQLVEQGHKTTSGLLTATLGPMIARITEFTAKKLIWPGSLHATKDDISDLKKQNNRIEEQNKKLLEHQDKKNQIETFL